MVAKSGLEGSWLKQCGSSSSPSQADLHEFKASLSFRSINYIRTRGFLYGVKKKILLWALIPNKIAFFGKLTQTSKMNLLKLFINLI